MRPVPPTKHILSIFIFLGISALVGYVAFTTQNFSEEQYYLASAAAKQADPDLFKYDATLGEHFSDGRIGKVLSPFFISLMQMVLTPAGYTDLMLPFRVMAGPMMFLFLCGMYALLWRQSHSSTASAFVAVLSSTLLPSLGGYTWGMGAADAVTPTGLVIAISPLLLLSYAHNAKRRQIVLTFGAIGLCGNLDILAAGNLALVLALTFWMREKVSFSSLLRGVAGLGFAALAMAPYGIYLWTLRQAAGGSAGTYDQAIFAIRAGGRELLFPALLGDLLQWGIHVAVLAAIVWVMLWRLKRFRAREADLWMWMFSSAIIIGVGLHGVCQWVAQMTDRPPVINFLQATSWVFPPLYVLFAQALTHLFRIARRYRLPLNWACAALMVAWMLPSDALRPLRHWVYLSVGGAMQEEDRPLKITELEARMAADNELDAIARWIRENTPPDAVIITGQEPIRPLAKRSLLIHRGDLQYVYFLSPNQLESWGNRVLQQFGWLNVQKPGQPISEAVFQLHQKKTYQEVPAWYAILPVRPSQRGLTPLEPVENAAWGKFWKIYKINLP